MWFMASVSMAMIKLLLIGSSIVPLKYINGPLAIDSSSILIKLRFYGSDLRITLNPGYTFLVLLFLMNLLFPLLQPATLAFILTLLLLCLILSLMSEVCFLSTLTAEKVARSLTPRCTAQLVHVLVTSRLDYCNSLFAGLPAVSLRPLQSVPNAAARLVSGCSRSAHIIISASMVLPLLILAVSSSLFLMLLHCRSALRSSSHGDLIVPRFRTVTMSTRCFA